MVCPQDTRGAAGSSRPGAVTDRRPPASLLPGNFSAVQACPPRSAVRDKRTFIDRVTAHAGALRRFARRLTRNPADAEDVLQDTLVRAMEKRDELRDPRQLRAWLMAIVRTSWLNSRRGLRNKLEVL